MAAEEQWKEIERKISEAVKLTKKPVAVTFLDAPPAGVEKFEGTEPSGCSFWRLAPGGKVFLHGRGESF